MSVKVDEKTKVDIITKIVENSPQEIEGRALGVIPSPYDERDFIYRDMVCVGEEPPEIIDYRPDLPPVFDQEKRGSCVACAITWTPKAYTEILEGNWPEGGLSAAYLYVKCKGLDGISGTEGTYPRIAMKVQKDYGICPEVDMPYSLLTALNPPRVPAIPVGADAKAAPFKISTYAQIAGNTDSAADRVNIINTMRAALKREGPFTIAVIVCDNFVPDEKGIVPLPYGFVRGGHMLGVVGDLPDLEYTYGGQTYKGCFIIRNSWGADWGLDGYCYFPYHWFLRVPDGYVPYVMEAWTQVDVSSINPNGAYKVIIRPGANTMKVDGKEVSLEQPAIIDPETERMLAPVRALGEAFNRKVEWINGEAVLTRIAQ